MVHLCRCTYVCVSVCVSDKKMKREIVNFKFAVVG